MKKLSGINFNNTNRLHLVLVIRIYVDKNLNYPKVYTSSKTPGQIKSPHKYPVYLICSKPSTQLYISNTAFYNT